MKRLNRFDVLGNWLRLNGICAEASGGTLCQFTVECSRYRECGSTGGFQCSDRRDLGVLVEQ